MIDLVAISLADESTAVLVGLYGRILRTTDGGETWEQQFSGTTENLLAVSFVDVATGTAVGENGTIVHTTTGGE